MITKREVLRVAKPIVLIAEELSAATLDALGPDFEVSNCDGANRAELLAELGKGVDAVLIAQRQRWMQKRLPLLRALRSLRVQVLV